MILRLSRPIFFIIVRVYAQKLVTIWSLYNDVVIFCTLTSIYCSVSDSFVKWSSIHGFCWSVKGRYPFWSVKDPLWVYYSFWIHLSKLLVLLYNAYILLIEVCSAILQPSPNPYRNYYKCDIMGIIMMMMIMMTCSWPSLC